MSMDYFRRPLLAGLNLSRLTNAVVRGTVRRADPSGGSASPYFPGISAGQQLTVVTQGGTHTATITDSNPSISSVLDDLNTALGAHATAFDADGVIGIRSNVAGASGFVEVTGGSASIALGFNTNEQEFRSVGGEVEGGPEGRVGNPFGVAFPGRTENWDIKSFNNALGRVAANMDVLYADMLREEPVPTKIAATVGGDGLWIRPNDTTQRVFTGYGLLSRTSTKEELAPFFYVIDTTTKMPATSRVVGCVRGTPTGIPGSDSPDFATSTGLNVLGQNLTKVSAAAITEITQGRAVKCSGETFITDGVQAGDLARIQASTNTSPWSNEGRYWVVERVVSEDVVWLRPMSKAETSMYGLSPSVAEVQPILELNSTKADSETWGTLTISTGSWCSGVTFVLDPPLPPDASVELWAAIPKTGRDRHVASYRESLGMSVVPIVSDYDPAPAGIILAPYATAGGGLDLDLSSGTARWNGRVVSIPATTLTLTDNATNYVYWDEKTGRLTHTTTAATVFVWDKNDPSAPASSATRGHLVAVAVTLAGAIVSIKNAARQTAEDVRTVTIGHGGQFVDLAAAAAYVSSWSEAKAENTDGADGAFPHFELVLVSDIEVPAVVEFNAPGLVLRGANPDVTIDFLTGASLLFKKPGTYLFENFQVTSSDGDDVVEKIAALDAGVADSRFLFRNVRTASIGAAYASIQRVVTGTNIVELVIESCDLHLSRGVAMTGSASSRVYFSNSVFTYVHGGSTEAQILSPVSGAGTWEGAFFSSTGCRYLGWFNEQEKAKAVFLVLNTSFSMVSFCGNYVDSGAFPTGAGNEFKGVLFYLPSGRAVLADNIFIDDATSTPKTIIDGGSDTIFQGNYCQVRPTDDGATWAAAVRAGHVIDNRIELLSPIVGTFTSVGVEAYKVASGNNVSGTARVGIRGASGASNVAILNNVIDVDGSGTVDVWGVQIFGNGYYIAGNSIDVAGSSVGNYGYGIAGDGNVRSGARLADNFINISRGVISGIGIYQLLVGMQAVGNYITLESAITYGLYLDGNGYFAGNTVYGASLANTVGIHLTNGDNFVKLIGNQVSATTESLTSTSTGGENRLIMGNEFFNAGAPQAVGRFIGNTCLNGIEVQTNSTVEGNFIKGDVTFALGGTGRCVFNNNLYVPSSGSSMSVTSNGTIVMSGNYIGANVTVNLTNCTNTIATGNYFGANVTFGGGSFASNYVAGTFSTPAAASSDCDIAGNKFAGAVNIGHGNGSFLQFRANYVGGSITSQATGRVLWTGNRQSTTATHSTAITGWSDLTYAFNYYGGCVELTSGVNSAARIFGNRIVAGTSATSGGNGAALSIGRSDSLLRGPVEVIGNDIDGTNFDQSAVLIYGGGAFPTAQVTFIGNRVVTATSGSSNLAALELFSVQGARVIGNTLIGYKSSLILNATDGSAATACLDVLVSGNWLESTHATASQPNVDVRYSNRATFTGNTLKRAPSLGVDAVQMQIAQTLSNTTDALATYVADNRLIGESTYVIVDNNAGTGNEDTFFGADPITTITNAGNIYGGGIRMP